MSSDSHSFKVAPCACTSHHFPEWSTFWFLLSHGGFPDGSEVENPHANAGDAGSVPGQEDSLEEVMAPHCSIPAWRILWTEEPGGLRSIGSQRVGCDWSNLAHTHIFTLSTGSAYRAHRGGISLCPPQAFLLRPEQKILRKEGGWREKGKERRKGGKENKEKKILRPLQLKGDQAFGSRPPTEMGGGGGNQVETNRKCSRLWMQASQTVQLNI